MESPESNLSHLDIEELAQTLFLLLGHDTVGRSSGVGTDELGDLERQLHLALSRTRMVDNSSSAVNRLPPELLAHIFSFLQPPISEPPFSLPKSFNSWLTVIHICRYWRIVAFAFPRLWNHIHIRNSSDGAAVTSIKRSAKVPLKVYCDFTAARSRRPSQSTNPLALLAEQTDRLQELHISSDAESIWNIFLSPAPSLETLSILGRWSPGQSDRSLPHLFSNHTPRLKKVTFVRISSWPLNDFHGLTHLSLYDQYNSQRTPLDEFMEILRLCPDLEELVLVRAGPNEGRGVLPSEINLTPVPLPCLRKLEIGDWITPEVSFFLSHLLISKRVTRCIWGDSLDDLSTLLNVDIEVDNTYSHILRVAIVEDNTSRSTRQMIGIKDTSLYIHGPATYPQFQSLFSDAILPNVLELILCPASRHMPSSSQLRNMLLGLPSLTTLRLSGAIRRRIHRVSSALGVFDDSKPDSDNSGIPSPLLHTVNIFNYGETEGDRYLDILPLVLLSQTRAELGYPIQTFEIEDCRRDQLDELEGYLGETRIQLHDPPVGKRIFEKLLNEMWRHIRYSTPTLDTM